MKLKIALIQMNSHSYSLEKNIKLALELANEALKQDAKIIVFPELFDSGYCVSNKDKNFAIDFKKVHKHKGFKVLSTFAKKHQIYIIACSIEKDKNKLYDSAYVIDFQGKNLGIQRKIYLWGSEKERFQRGNAQKIFNLAFGQKTVQIGIGICYEIGFPELSRALALKGAKILIYPSAFGKARTYVWELASRARAIENACFVLACNRSGFEYNEHMQKLEFAGLSAIINPKGDFLARANEENQCIVAELDLDLIEEQRRNLPYLKDLDLKLNKKLFNRIKKKKDIF